MGKLDGKVAIVTGAAHGLGASHALSLAREGADVAVVDIAREQSGTNYAMGTKDEQLDVVKDIQAMGRRAIAIQCDVSRSAEVEAMVKKVVEEFGSIDILVNNAGIGPGTQRLWELSEEQLSRMLDVNLKSLFYCCKHVLPHMIQQNSGKIVNIGSKWGQDGGAGGTAYAAAKAGVHQLTHVLAKEVAQHNINVNAVAPGSVRTPMSAQVSEEIFLKYVMPTQLLGRPIIPQDISNAVVFLASEDSRSITGSVIYVDGGRV